MGFRTRNRDRANNLRKLPNESRVAFKERTAKRTKTGKKIK